MKAVGGRWMLPSKKQNVYETSLSFLSYLDLQSRDWWLPILVSVYNCSHSSTIIMLISLEIYSGRHLEMLPNPLAGQSCLSRLVIQSNNHRNYIRIKSRLNRVVRTEVWLEKEGGGWECLRSLGRSLGRRIELY